MVETLAAHRKRQLEELMKAGKAWRDHGFIFCNEIGELYSQVLLACVKRRQSRASFIPKAYARVNE